MKGHNANRCLKVWDHEGDTNYLQKCSKYVKCCDCFQFGHFSCKERKNVSI